MSGKEQSKSPVFQRRQPGALVPRCVWQRVQPRSAREAQECLNLQPAILSHTTTKAI